MPAIEALGPVEYPAPAEASLIARDPIQGAMIGLFAAGIRTRLAAAWTAATVGTQLAGTNVVASTLPDMPSVDHLQQQRVTLPLLAVHPQGDQTHQLESLETGELMTRWVVTYVVGALSLDHRRRLKAVLREITRIITKLVSDPRDASWDNGRVQFLQRNRGTVEEPDWAPYGVTLMRVVGSAVGEGAFGEDAKLYSMATVTIEVSERERDFTDDIPALTGLDTTASLEEAVDVEWYAGEPPPEPEPEEEDP